ncbi:MBL fold metallo-hydrolase [Romboutsia weinsteinii]|uniref:MBL fold metallo-hydrolase n=1 Tax=Romboutsia weinsteinii TaxID=2020949 RepID=A0A371J8P4_9FIRM|nr:MBL fold metallo-hydrolase [Romboutsia weinsteinii]RDY29150.1 MBL fold metallo-hydrolase [Romboutsia weinsteinii]
MIIEKVVDTYFGENTYLLGDTKTKKCAVIDPGADVNDILRAANKHNLNIEYIILTHGHGDHIANVKRLKEKTNAQIIAHADEAEILLDGRKNLSTTMRCGRQEFDADIYVQDKEKMNLGELRVSFIHTPGHTKGGMCIRVADDMFTGDTLFAGSMGRTDLYSGDYKQIDKSLKKLARYEDNVKVHPGHGPSTTLGIEKRSNPYM